jgi:hypothetical protein
MGTDPNSKDKLQAELARRMNEALSKYAKEHGLSEEEVMRQALELLSVKSST